MSEQTKLRALVQVVHLHWSTFFKSVCRCMRTDIELKTCVQLWLHIFNFADFTESSRQLSFRSLFGCFWLLSHNARLRQQLSEQTQTARLLTFWLLFLMRLRHRSKLSTEAALLSTYLQFSNVCRFRLCSRSHFSKVR